jgi:hypothetical protein
MMISNIVAGSTKTGLTNLGIAFLAIWSYLEITKGASRFRQVLGIGVAIAVVYGFFR